MAERPCTALHVPGERGEGEEGDKETGRGGDCDALLLMILASINLVLVFAITVYLIWGVMSIRRMADLPFDEEEFDLPSVSIIAPARNEEACIEAALASLLQQDYEKLEFILINDRSTDKTGEILAAAADSDPRVRFIQIDDLPAGWLGKNHALHVAAELATGDYLLFVDADVVMDAKMIRRAMQVVRRDNLDHFTCGFEARMPSSLLRCTVALFTICFAIFFRPWKAKDPRSSAYIGIGGFNLVRASAYHEVDGHKSIAMRPDDDVKLGKVLKEAGFRQEFFDAAELIYVPWYASLPELTVGLEKNAFAVFHYRLWLMLTCSLMLLYVPGAPMISIWITHGAAWWINLIALLLVFLLTGLVAKGLRFSPLCVVWLPIVLPLFTWVIWRAAWLTYRQGGIRWRGTLYSLDELRGNSV